MPEILKYEDLPKILIENQVEPFREGYIPGSRLLCREWSSSGYDVFFHIRTPVAKDLDAQELDGLARQVRGWWRAKSEKAADHTTFNDIQ